MFITTPELHSRRAKPFEHLDDDGRSHLSNYRNGSRSHGGPRSIDRQELRAGLSTPRRMGRCCTTTPFRTCWWPTSSSHYRSRDRARVDPLMSAFNLKDARAGTTSRRWFICILGCGAALAKSISRNKNSPKRSPLVHRDSIVHQSMQLLM